VFKLNHTCDLSQAVEKKFELFKLLFPCIRRVSLFVK